MQKKIDKALYGPGMLEVGLGAVLGLLLGVVVACVFLVLKPVKTVKEPAKEPVAGTIYYLPGSENSAKSRGWQQKQQSLVANGTVELNEEELNAWAAAMRPAAAKPATPAKPGAKAGAKPEPAAPPATAGLLTTSAPNFRIKDGLMQIGVKCTVSVAGISQEVLLVATGSFRKGSESIVFVPASFYVGSCPLHKIPGVTGPLLRKIAALQPLSAELRAAWDRLTAVELEGSTLRLAAQ